MRLLISAAALSVGLTTSLFGEEKQPALPTGLPPTYAVARTADGGKLLLERPAIVAVQEERVRAKDVGGRKVQERYTVIRYVVKHVTQEMAFKTVDVYNAAGEKLGTEDARDELKKRQVVLVSTDGEKISPFYLSIVKPSTLVIVDRSLKPESGVVPPARPKRAPKP